MKVVSIPTDCGDESMHRVMMILGILGWNWMGSEDEAGLEGCTFEARKAGGWTNRQTAMLRLH